MSPADKAHWVGVSGITSYDMISYLSGVVLKLCIGLESLGHLTQRLWEIKAQFVPDNVNKNNEEAVKSSTKRRVL